MLENRGGDFFDSHCSYCVASSLPLPLTDL